ncbi:hypothetical protein ACHAXS_000874 [Conticribra weissflogii]
MDPSSHR